MRIAVLREECHFRHDSRHFFYTVRVMSKILISVCEVELKVNIGCCTISEYAVLELCDADEVSEHFVGHTTEESDPL